MNKKNFIITIDGPAGSGKTTIAKILSAKLNFLLLESGSLYRTVTYLWLKCPQPLNEFLKNLKKFFEQEIKIKLLPSGTNIYLGNKLLKDELKSKEVEDKVSEISTIKEVRFFLTEFMRNLINKKNNKNLIAEGRDMGNVVFPEADLKIFLTAKEEIRVQRRYKEIIDREKRELSYEEVLNNIKFRDKLDSERSIAPLIIPDGAYVIDTSYLTPEQIIEKILQKLKEK